MSSTTLAKLSEFETLPEGWSYGEGGPISDTSIATQIIVDAMKQGLNKTDVFPGLNGEISVSIYGETNYIEFIVEKDEKISFLHENNGEEVSYDEDLNLNEALLKLHQVQEDTIWDISECYIKDFMTPMKEGSAVWHLDHQVMEEFQYSTNNAQKLPATQSAGTLIDFMHQVVLATSPQ